jgi:hypothetical protein
VPLPTEEAGEAGHDVPQAAGLGEWSDLGRHLADPERPHA